mmetsp:Transcript_23656/g.42930  ORF Transcript_23656/g.42930 Transcript_23656/m.42930 type:complete len:369 (+) Transcript_23656:1-1107(+)
MTFYRLLVALLALSQLQQVTSFTFRTPIWAQSARNPRLTASVDTHAKKPLSDRNEHESNKQSIMEPTMSVEGMNSWDRRTLVESMAASVVALGSLAVSPSSAMVPYNLACLLDLPPVPKDCVRIYLCRHGQTENNRLGKVQGARVDPPINYNGLDEAKRLGTALDKLKDKCPSLIYHSNLRRSSETAKTVSRIIQDDDKPISLIELSSIREVDFGSVAEGKPLSDARGGMLRTFGSWAAGFVAERGDGGGESGREVMERIASSLRFLVKEANENGGSVIAISHSKFNRVLLAVMEDKPLIQGAAIQQANCCINVLDLKRDGSTTTLGPKCNLLGGPLSNAPDDFSLQIPVGKVVRVNEKRHLENLEFS